MPLVPADLSGIQDIGAVPKNIHFKEFQSVGSSERCTAGIMPVHPPKASSALADAVRSILSACGLSFSELSRRSQHFENRLAHIPHSFYSSLRNRTFTPSLYQLHSLSRLSGYRLVDWLALFGFFLDDVSRFQLLFPSHRTVELDATVHRYSLPVPHLQDLKEADLRAPLTPLSQWVALSSPRYLQPFLRNARNSFRYLKIGSRDALAFPDLLPGSVVRVKEDCSVFERTPIGKRPGRTLFLVRHYGGMACSRLLRTEREKIVLCSRQLPYAPIELRTGTEAAVLGTADLEFRPLVGVAKPVVSARLERYRPPRPLDRAESPPDVGGFILRARVGCGLSFREASSRTRVIARRLGDRRYYCSPSTLSDYETRRFAPRHIHKVISICSVYFLNAGQFLEACGIPPGAEERPMPAAFLRAIDESHTLTKPSRFLRSMERKFGPIPWFLRTAGYPLFGLPNLSPRDVFWVGDSPKPKYACLAGIRLLIVDRRQKRPRVSLSSPNWAQPIFVVQRRGGEYIWGFCRLENGTLAIYGPARHAQVTRLRNRVDAEVVGRVVGIIRNLA